MRLIVPLIRQHRHEIEGCENAWSNRCVDAAGEHHVLATECDVLRGVSHRVSGARATTRDDVRQTTQPKRHRQLARESAVRRSWNRVNARFAGWTNVPVFVLLFSEGETTAARSELYAE